MKVYEKNHSQISKEENMNRKRVISWILIFAMVIGFAPVNIYASDVPQKQEVTAEGDFQFDASSGTI